MPDPDFLPTLGKMVRVEQGSQNRYFMYDSLGRTIRVRQPEQEVNTGLNTSGNPDNNGWSGAFTYDNNGNALTATDAKGTTITSTYDALNRPLTRTYSDGTPAVTNTYDNPAIPYSKGKLAKVTSSVSETQYSGFDLAGRLTESKQVTDGTTYTSSYQYNLSGALTQETYPSGRVVQNVLDRTGNLSIVESKKDGDHGFWHYADSFAYNASGAITKMQLGNGLWETAQFNSRLQVSELALGTTDSNASVWKNDYEFGELQTGGTVDPTRNNGNIGKQTLTVPGTSFVQSYQHDPLNRLTEAQEKTGSTQNWVQQFGYDQYGNRTSFSQTVGSTTTNTTPSVNASTNRFSTGQGFGYDANGNVTADVDPMTTHNRSFTFNGDNKQTQVADTTASQTVGQYSYDGEGRRVKKVTDTETTIFVYSFGRVVAEYSTQLSSTPAVHYTTADHLGSPRVISNELGHVISRRDFMPFGEEINSGVGGRTSGLNYASNDDDVRQKFTGYQKDSETSLDFAEARMYESRYGRFTAIDPLMVSSDSSSPQSWNRYIYVLNNPLVMIDPNGESPGDYYDRDDGSYLGNDGIDDHKVYSGKEKSRTKKDGKIYRQVGDVHDLGITDVEFNTISNIIRQEGATNDTNEYLWIAHATNNCVQTNCQKMPVRTMFGLLSTRYSTVPNGDKTQLSPEDDSLRANAARAGVIDVLLGGADPTSGATFWDGTDFILRGGSHRKFSDFDSVLIRNDVFNSYVGSQGGSSIRLKRRRYANPNPFFNQNQGSWDLDGKPESGFLYRKNSGRGILYATGTAGKSIFWSTNYKWTK